MKRRIFAGRVSVVVGFAISGVFLWQALRRVDGDSLVSTFADIRLPPVGIAACALAVGMFLRSVRWRLVAGMPPERQAAFARATYLGVLANLLLPGRLGEFVRVVTLGRLSGSTLALPLASAVIDRLLDLLVLILCTFGLYLVLPVDVVLENWLKYLVIFVALLAIGLAAFVKHPGLIDQGMAAFARRWRERWSLRPDVFMSELRKEFHGLLGGWIGIEVVLVAGSVLMVDYLAIACLLLAVGITPSLAAPLLVLVFLAVGSALPSAPSYVGVYQAAAVLALAYFAVPPEPAVAMATVLQLLTLMVALALNGRGVFGLIRQALASGRGAP
jgi:hypothetical protein